MLVYSIINERFVAVDYYRHHFENIIQEIKNYKNLWTSEVLYTNIVRIVYNINTEYGSLTGGGERKSSTFGRNVFKNI